MTKISDLSAFTGASVDTANDLITMVDISAVGTARNKKMTFDELLASFTAKSPQFTAVNIGHATDTTVARASAGDISVEGNIIYRLGGTDVAVADGGTGSSTAAGARTNLGATTAGANIFTLANPSAITFLRVNADNTVDALSAAAFRTAIGASTGTGSGDLLAANNLSDLANAATARANLGINSTNVKLTESLIIACSDETTAITAGTGKVTFRMPYAFTVSAVRASVTTAPTGSTILIDINESGTTILSTKLMIDATEKTSTTAATPAVISDSSLADDAEITVDFDQVGSTIAGAGVKVYLIGTRT